MNNPHPLAPFLAMLLLTGCGSGDQVGEADAPPPLVVAAERGDLSALDALLGKASKPDVRDACQWTPLMKASLNGHLALVDRLLGAGADPQAEDKGGYTPVLLAASNNHAEVVELLLEHAAKLNAQERTQGWTALIWAAKQGHLAAVEVLLGHGADPGSATVVGVPPRTGPGSRVPGDADPARGRAPLTRLPRSGTARVTAVLLLRWGRAPRYGRLKGAGTPRPRLQAGAKGPICLRS